MSVFGHDSHKGAHDDGAVAVAADALAVVP